MAADSTVRIFLERADLAATTGIIDLFHAVRRIPYSVTGDRSARGVVERWRGSCSGKHVLLSLVLQDFGHTSRIVTVETTVDRGLPEDSGVPSRLREIALRGIVPDFHHFVQIYLQGHWLNLDATWDDSMEAHGFPVNRSWDERSDTRLAFAPIRVVGYSSVEGLATRKAQLLDGLSATQQKNRQEFFFELTQWLNEQVRENPSAPLSGTGMSGSQSGADRGWRW